MKTCRHSYSSHRINKKEGKNIYVSIKARTKVRKTTNNQKEKTIYCKIIESAILYVIKSKSEDRTLIFFCILIFDYSKSIQPSNFNNILLNL